VTDYLGRTIHDDAEHATEDLVRLANALIQPDANGRTFLDRIRAAMNGQPQASRCDTDRVTASGISDPTGNAAIRSDKARDDMVRLTAIFRRLRADTDQAVMIANNWSARAASEHEKRRTQDENEPHCESCSRVEIAKGVSWWVEPHSNGSGYYRTTVGDTLTEAMWLCQWCRDHTTTRGCLPSHDELEQHRDGKRIRCPHPEKQAVA
jgi:hypothetical protein